MFDDEDIERMKATSEKFADTIIKAFRLRYPVETVDSKAVTINSLLLVLQSFVKSLPDKEEAKQAAEAIHFSWICFRNELDEKK